MKEYDYTVEYVGRYWSLKINLSLDLDDTIGNMSEEAREKAEELANTLIEQDISLEEGSCLVSLVLDGEEHYL